ncbi:unnamed protein product, partial [Trichogramma brassicae]
MPKPTCCEWWRYCTPIAIFVDSLFVWGSGREGNHRAKRKPAISVCCKIELNKLINVIGYVETIFDEEEHTTRDQSRTFKLRKFLLNNTMDDDFHLHVPNIKNITIIEGSTMDLEDLMKSSKRIVKIQIFSMTCVSPMRVFLRRTDPEISKPNACGCQKDKIHTGSMRGTITPILKPLLAIEKRILKIIGIQPYDSDEPLGIRRIFMLKSLLRRYGDLRTWRYRLSGYVWPSSKDPQLDYGRSRCSNLFL